MSMPSYRVGLSGLSRWREKSLIEQVGKAALLVWLLIALLIGILFLTLGSTTLVWYSFGGGYERTKAQEAKYIADCRANGGFAALTELNRYAGCVPPYAPYTPK